MNLIGNEVTVIIDRKVGSIHPKYPNIKYEVNYGYVEGIFSLDKEELDAYILGIDEELDNFTGVVIAIIHRINDIEDKLVVAKRGVCFTDEEIKKLTYFQEQYFDIEIIR